MNSIKVIPKRGKKVPKNIWEMKDEDIFWKEHPGCSNFIISDSGCDLRISEMQIISFTPLGC